MNTGDLKAIALAPWPWQERFAITCGCCHAIEEFFCAQSKPLDVPAARERVITTALSASGWMLMREDGREVWLCARCSSEATDGSDPVYLAAASRWLAWKRIEVSITRGAMS